MHRHFSSLCLLGFLFVLLPAFPSLSYGQGTGRMQKQEVTAGIEGHDFGVIERGSDRVVDIVFHNNDQTNALVLTTDHLPEYTVLWSARSVAPDSSITLRVKFNPRKKGKYKDEVKVFFSNMMTPLTIEMRAEVKYIDRSDNPACPSFRERAADCCGEDQFTVEVVDQATGAAIRGARVRIYEHGRQQRDVKTDRSGRYSEDIPIGYYFTHASAEGYLPADTTGYINRRNNFVRLELEAMTEEVVENLPLESEEEEEEVVEIITGGVPEPITVEENIRPAQAEEKEVEITSERLPEDRFAPNRLVFLVDVSQSMFYKSRLELLKAGMLEMLDVLRPVDQLALVTYAETTEEVIGMTPATEKPEIEKRISALNAAGRTSGAKGFRRAYGILERAGRDENNRQLIVVTDGAFRTADAKKISTLAEEYAAKGIHTTIVGVRCSDSSREKLEEIATACGGHLLIIDDIDDGGEVLLKEVARRSQIKG